MAIDKRIIWITQSALFLALVISVQAATAALQIQLLTGSLVNLMLILCVMLCGLPHGITVAALSPLFAKLLGIGPLWELIPFVSAGNVILVLIWFFIGNLNFGNGKTPQTAPPEKEARSRKDAAFKAALPHLPRVLALISGAAAKFLFLYLTIARLAVPYLLNLSEGQAKAISAVFSFQQLFTALIGGAAAIVLIPLIKRAVKTRRT